MSETVTLESPDGRRIRTDSPTEIKTLTAAHGYRVVDNTSSNSKDSKQSRSSRKTKQDTETEPAHEPDTNPIDPQTRADTA